MKISRFSRTSSFVAVAILVLTPQPFAQAVNSPKLTLVAPANGSSFYWNTPQKISFELQGGWASELNSCDELANYKFGFWGKMTYGPKKSLILYSTSAENYPFTIWNSVLTPNGIKCTVEINGMSDLSSLKWQSPWWIRNGYDAVFDIRGHDGNIEEVSGNQNVSFGWTIDGKTEQTSFTSQEAEVGIEFIGLTRGESIEYFKNYKIKISKVADAPVVNINGLSDCEKKDAVVLNRVSTTTFDCILYTNVTGLKSIAVSTVGYVKNYSKSVSVTVVKAGTPHLDWTGPRISLTNDSSYNKEFIRVQMFGQLRLKEGNVAEASGSLKVCVNTFDCQTLITDPKSPVAGSFSYDRIFPHKPGSTIKWSVEANYDGIFFRESGEEVIEPIAKPVPSKPNPITSLSSSVPKSVKWGKSFFVSLTPKGKGSASCYLWFQATSPTQGRYDFTITAGKTTKVLITPTYYQLAAWPISLRCWPKNWNNQYFDRSLGKIILTN